MADTKIVSRKSLFADENEDVKGDTFLPGGLDLEFEETTGGDFKLKEEERQEGEVFQLFSNTGAVQVDFSSPEPEQVHAKRPDSYYFSKPDQALKQQFESVALNGEDIIKMSTKINPGMTMPWKVIDFNKFKEKSDLERLRARRRPGKKAREKRKVLMPKIPQDEQPRNYGPDRTYSNPKLEKNNNNKRGNNKKRLWQKGGGRGRQRRGRGGRGGYPRKPGSG